MKEKKNIDRLFQEKLKDFEVSPEAHVWEQIESKLNQKKKDRKVIPFWWRLAGVAAALVLMMGIGYNLFNQSNKNLNSPLVNQEVDTSEDNISGKPNHQMEREEVVFENASDIQFDTNTKEINNTSVTSQEKDQFNQTKLATSTEDRADSQKKSKADIHLNNQFYPKDKTGNAVAGTHDENTNSNIKLQNDAINQTNDSQEESQKNKSIFNFADSDTKKDAIVENAIKDNNTEKEITSDLVEKLKEEKSIEEAIAELEELTNEKEKEVLNRWRISPNVAPVYFNSLGEGSNIHSQFVENGKTSNISMSYGIAASYAINKKLKIRTGVSNVNFDYRTNDVMTTIGLARSAANSQSSIPNIKLNQNASTSNFMSGKAVSLASAPEIVKSSKMTSLEQQFGFIEVPLELEYSLIDKKLGLNVIGGFSTFFLNNNNLFLVEQGGSSLIGESANLNDVSYSANFGLGMFYNFSKAFQFNLEPMFKYQINTFNNTSGDFQPFFMGVYTGFSFKF